jgi:hypothetical protein
MTMACGGTPGAADEGDPEASSGEDDSGSDDAPIMDFLGEECDPYNDACEEGFKCGPIALQPYSHIFTEYRCVPVLNQNGLDDPCTSWGLRPEDYDNCDVGLVCWGAKPEVDPMPGGAANQLPIGGLTSAQQPETPRDGGQLGLCRSLCQGTPEEPDCGGKWGRCLSSNGVDLCIHTCNPLDTNCDSAKNCIWDEPNQTLSCIHMPPDVLELGDDCTGQGFACPSGTHCDPAAYVPGCQGEYCCNSWCATDGSVSCEWPEQTCVPFWPEDDFPPGQDLLGSCQVL